MDNSASDHTKPPVTIQEVGIHIGYMRDDIKELRDIVKEAASNYATREEVTSLAVRLDTLEKKNGLKTTLMWVAMVSSVLINLFALLNYLGNK